MGWLGHNDSREEDKDDLHASGRGRGVRCFSKASKARSVGVGGVRRVVVTRWLPGGVEQK